MKTEKTSNLVEVLNKGYVRLVDVMGTELSVVNAARASFAKESKELDDKDERLIKFLVREGHLSPFRHCFVTLEIKAPLEITRQWQRYAIGSAHTDSFSTAISEMSRRYVTGATEFYLPNADQWRSAPENRKQGSAEPINSDEGQFLTEKLQSLLEVTTEAYEDALERGVAPEVARLFLMGYGMYITWRWSTSLQGLAFFLNQRLEEGAQSEIQEYAKAVLELTEPHFPISLSELVRGDLRD